MRRRTRLEYALMCLMARVPRTGSSLVRTLREYPLAGIGQSPGAVYPALRRLERAGLVTTRLKKRHEPEARWRERMKEVRSRGRPVTPTRRFKEYLLTDAGLKELRRWAVRPVTRAEMLERPDDLLLRLGFLPGLCGREPTIDFLRGYAGIAEELADEMSRILGARRTDASLWVRLGLELTLTLFEVRAAWGRRAVHELERAPSGAIPAPRKP